jgi:hypothetical protein
MKKKEPGVYWNGNFTPLEYDHWPNRAGEEYHVSVAQFILDVYEDPYNGIKERRPLTGMPYGWWRIRKMAKITDTKYIVVADFTDRIDATEESQMVQMEE